MVKVDLYWRVWPQSQGRIKAGDTAPFQRGRKGRGISSPYLECAALKW